MIRVALKELLRVRGISQRELARRIGRHPDVVSKFAREATNGVSYELLDLICAELGCEPGMILRCETDDPHQTTLFPAEKGDTGPHPSARPVFERHPPADSQGLGDGQSPSVPEAAK